MERYFFSTAFRRWVKENQVEFTTDSASATLQDESSEAQNGPESDGNLPIQTDNHVGDEGQVAYPTEARERQKAREKRAKEKGVTNNVQKRKKFVEDHFDDCGDDISSIVENIYAYHSTTVILDELSESSDDEDYSYLSYMMWGSNMIQSVSLSQDSANFQYGRSYKYAPGHRARNRHCRTLRRTSPVPPLRPFADLCVLAQISI